MQHSEVDEVLNFMRQGYQMGNVKQKFTQLYCYLDIPIDTLIDNLYTVEKQQRTIELLTTRSFAIIDWIKRELNEGRIHIYVHEYIDYLKEHSRSTRDFVRVALGEYEGTYVESSDEKFAGIDESYCEMYDSFTKYFMINKVNIPINMDLRKLPSDVERPMIKHPD